MVVNNRTRVRDADRRGPADRVTGEIARAGGEAVAEYSDAADPAGGAAMLAAAVSRWGRLDICVVNAAIGVGGMFHRQPAAQFDEVLEINLHGAVRFARAAMAVMRPAGFGRIILVASTGGLCGDVGLSAYAASKGGLLAFGRSLAAEGLVSAGRCGCSRSTWRGPRHGVRRVRSAYQRLHPLAAYAALKLWLERPEGPRFRDLGPWA